MRIVIFLLLLLLLQSCLGIEGVQYTISEDCNGHRGWWTPNRICYDGTMEVRLHEECHQLKWELGLDPKDCHY